MRLATRAQIPPCVGRAVDDQVPSAETEGGAQRQQQRRPAGRITGDIGRRQPGRHHERHSDEGQRRDLGAEHQGGEKRDDGGPGPSESGDDAHRAPGQSLVQESEAQSSAEARHGAEQKRIRSGYRVERRMTTPTTSAIRPISCEPPVTTSGSHATRGQPTGEVGRAPCARPWPGPRGRRGSRVGSRHGPGLYQRTDLDTARPRAAAVRESSAPSPGAHRPEVSVAIESAAPHGRSGTRDPPSPPSRSRTSRRRSATWLRLGGINLEIADGEFFSMLGPSGSGKTTTLRLIAGFELPTAGRVLLHGKDVSAVPPFDRDVNTVFQDYALFPHMTVGENIAYGLEVRKVAERRARCPRRRGDGDGPARGVREAASQVSFPAGSASASPWPAPSSTGPGSCSSTSRSGRSTSSSGSRCRSS